MLGGKLERVLAGGRLEGAVTGGLQHVPEQLHVHVVVLDDEDELSCHQVASARAGSVKVNVLPSPRVLSIQIRPPCSSTNRLESASPRPVPSRCSAPTSVCWNSSKIRSWSSGATPGPVSATETQTSPSTRAERISTLPPAGVNLTAFESRLKTTCRIRRSSPATIPTEASIVRPSSTPFLIPRSLTMTTPRSSASRSENGAISNST